MDKATPTPSPASVDSFKFNKAVDPMPGHELCGDYARALLAAQPSGTNLAQECAKARRHGFLDALSSGTARELCALLRRGVNQLEAWHAKYGEHQPQWLPPAGDVRWMEDVAAALDGRAALRAEVERLAAQAVSAPAVRMLTEVLFRYESMKPVDGFDAIYKEYATTFGRYPDDFMAQVVRQTKEDLFMWWGAHREKIRAGLVLLAAQEDASSGATTQAVRMLTREELNDVALSEQVGWGPGEYVEAVQLALLRVNAGRTIPADGVIGGAA